jgi:molybdate-binding protein/DNA-binding transcriptional regulator YhcF (GntR family)
MSFLYQEIAESLRQQIAQGNLQPGDRLPSVRDTALQWRCTPGTVGRAYRQLADEGLIDGHRGGGTRVIDNVLAAQPPRLKWAELVNRAEKFLLGSLNAGYSPSESLAALTMAVSRWETLQQQAPASAVLPALHSTLRFAGSHDLAVEYLMQRLQQNDPGNAPQINFVGSLGGLIAMARDEADIAGVHLWDAATGTYNVPYVRRLLPGRRVALLTLTLRALGLIVPRGNPQQLAGLNDLTRDDVRWINRQAGSGTRVWFDEQLRAANIDPKQITGYDSEETTHMNVALAIHAAEATAGLGIQAAAAAFGLHFLPLTEEIYQLVVPEAIWESHAWQAVLETIRSTSFTSTISELGGYNIATSGEVAWL